MRKKVSEAVGIHMCRIDDHFVPVKKPVGIATPTSQTKGEGVGI